MIKEKNKSYTFLGVNIWKIFFYFILYSFFGYIIETIFGIATKGVWESRQSFIYGPFCGIYGIGAICIIIFSQYFNKNNFTLFIGGYALGSIVEYFISFMTETILHTQWWDYSDRIMNVNGRICLIYSIFWGILTIFLIKKFNPLIERGFEKIENLISDKLFKILILIVILFLALDCLMTCYSQDKFITRLAVENNIELSDIDRRRLDYNRTKENVVLNTIVNDIWNNRKMIRTFPNIKIEDVNKNVIYLDSLLPEIQPYYLKVFEK